VGCADHVSQTLVHAGRERSLSPLRDGAADELRYRRALRGGSASHALIEIIIES